MAAAINRQRVFLRRYLSYVHSSSSASSATIFVLSAVCTHVSTPQTCPIVPSACSWCVVVVVGVALCS